MADQNIAIEVALRAATREYARAMKEAEEATKDFSKKLKEAPFARFNRGLQTLTKTALGLAAATATIQQLVEEIIQAGIEFQRLNKILIAATGSVEAANREYQFLSDTFNDLGLSIRESGQEYAKFLIAAQGTVFQGQAARDIFVNLSTALSGIGSSAANTSAIFDQLTQILAKPTTQMEDLLVIAERLPGTFDALAEGLKRPKEEIFELISASDLLAKDWLGPFSEVMRDRIPASAQSAEQAFIKLENAIFELEVAIANSGLLDAAASFAGILTNVAEKAGEATIKLRALKDAQLDLKTATELVSESLLVGPEELLLLYAELTGAQERLGREYKKQIDERIAAENLLAESTEKRAALEVQLAKAINERARLQKTAEEEAIKASQERLEQASKDNITAQKEYLSALKKTLREGERLENDYADEVKSLRKELADFNKSAEEASRDARLAELSDRERQAAILDEIAQKETEYSALTLQGQAERAAAAAEEALELSRQVDNARQRERIQREAGRAFEYNKEIQIRAAEEQRQAQEKQNVETQKSIDEQIKKIGDLKNELQELTSEDQVITIDADLSAVEEKIEDLKRQIEDLNRTIEAGGRAGGGAIGFASGGAPRTLRPGMIRGPGTSTSDSILARVSTGEHAFITKADRARKLWPLLNTLNFGSDAMVRQVLDNLPAGLGRTSRPIPISGNLAGGGAPGSGMTSVNIMLPGSSAPAARLFGERDEVMAFEDALARWSRGYAS